MYSEAFLRYTSDGRYGSAPRPPSYATPLEAVLVALRDFPDLLPEELVFIVATEIMGRGHMEIGLRMLSSIIGSEAIVGKYAEAILAQG